MERKKIYFHNNIFWYNCHKNPKGRRFARFRTFKRTFDFCSDVMALKKKKKKTSMFLNRCCYGFVFIFQHGEKHFNNSRIRKILTFDVILLILACMIRAFFAQNNCFLHLVFLLVCLFVFCFSLAGFGRMCSEAKTLLLSVTLGKYLPYCECLVSRKFEHFWKFPDQNLN